MVLLDLDWLSDLDWGSVPAWLGAGSLIIAYLVFLRDRGNSERAQIDRVGAWATVEYERRLPGDLDPVVEGKITGHMRNASQLPVKIRKIAYTVETRWMVEDQPLDPSGVPRSWTIEPGTQSQMAFNENVRVPPEDTIRGEFSINVAHMAPDGAAYLGPTEGMTAHVEWLLVVDNAGRRWVVHPEKGGRARRVRWRWRPREEHMPRTW